MKDYFICFFALIIGVATGLEIAASNCSKHHEPKSYYKDVFRAGDIEHDTLIFEGADDTRDTLIFVK